jgi:hypothetical protein
VETERHVEVYFNRISCSRETAGGIALSNNDLILLKQLLEQKRQELAPDLPEAEYFQLFASEQALKDHDLSYDEINQGVVDGGGDGGIDGVFLFVNGTLTAEAVDPTEFKRGVSLELVFIQAKTSSGFSEAAVDRFLSSTRDLLDLNTNLDSLASVYRADLLSKMSDFRETYLALASKFPKLSIRYCYAALGTEVHPNVDRRVAPLRALVESQFSPVAFVFEFLTAGRLLALARMSPSTAHQLRLAESPIATGDQGYLCLVGLRDYCAFVTEDDGALKERVFEGNVRDYQGNTEVNKAIRDTLAEPGEEDFWWLNNGVSIICASATLSGKTLTVENPEVVNGLQTSREIFHVFSSAGRDGDTRNILVRVLVPGEDESRDRIIRATNSQTTIPIASLRATDRIHRNIEEFLTGRGLFYDRRKNYYKNQGKPVKSIVSISSLAQCVLACAMRDPGNARARPSSLLKRDDDYGRIFDESHPLAVYHVSAVLGRRIEEALRLEECAVERSHWNNIRYYALMLLGLRLAGGVLPSMQQLAAVNVEAADDGTCLQCIRDAWDEYEAMGGTDQVAKGSELGTRLIEQHRQAVLGH